MPKNVLFVDDYQDARTFYEDYLTMECGARVITAKNGREGLEILRKEKIDAVVTDLSMPVMSGEDMMEEMVKDETLRQIPVVAETALGTPGTGRDRKATDQFKGRLNMVCFTRGAHSWEAISRKIAEILTEQK